MTVAAAYRIVEFPSEGAVLRGRFYQHAGHPRAIVVMAHGFSATISAMVADRYAEVLHRAGLNVLLYDHKGLGLSGGEPRRVLNRWTQAVGYRDAITFASTLPAVDASRVAIWGDSMSGGVAICVAAFDERVAALVVQVPACGSTVPPDDPDARAFAALLDLYRTAGWRGLRVETTGRMPVVSDDQATRPSLLEPITAHRWFTRYGGTHETGWANDAELETVLTPVPLQPGLCAPHLGGPSFWAIAADDEMPGAATVVSQAACASAPEPKEVRLIDGGHFGLLYHPSPLFEQVSQAEADFLIRHLGESRTRRPSPVATGDRAHDAASSTRPQLDARPTSGTPGRHLVAVAPSVTKRTRGRGAVPLRLEQGIEGGSA